MKKLQLIILLSFLSLTLQAQVNANFTSSISQTCLMAQFTNQSTSTNPIASYDWTIASNTFSTTENATYTFAQAGTYEVCLTVMDNAGNSNTFCEPITIVAAPQVQIIGNETLSCQDATVLLEAVPPIPNNTNTWRDPNGNIISTNTGIYVNNAGTYTYETTDTDFGCTSTNFITVGADSDFPLAVIQTPDLISCGNQTVTLDGTGSSTGANYIYTWRIGNYELSNDISIEVAAAGLYTLEVARANMSWCKSTAMIEVTDDGSVPNINVPTSELNDTIYQCEETFYFTEKLIDASCTNCTVEISGADGTVIGNSLPYVYDFSIFIFTAPPLTLTITDDNGCSNAALLELPEGGGEVMYISKTNESCSGANDGSIDLSHSGFQPPYTYDWLDLPGTNDPLDRTDLPAGTYTLLITNVHGCVGSQPKVFEIKSLPIADASATDSVQVINCDIPNITFPIILNGSKSSSGTDITYQWFDENNTLVGTEVMTEVNNLGTYTLVVTDNITQCSNSDVVTLSVEQSTDIPIADAGPSQHLDCNTVVVTLDGSASSTGINFIYEWQNANGSVIGNTLLLEVTIPGVYTLLVTDISNGCTSSDQVAVTQDDAFPDPPGIPNMTICEGEMVSITADIVCFGCTNIEIYDPNENLVCNSLPCSFAPVEGSYYAIATNGGGCTNDGYFVISIAEPLQITNVQIQPPSSSNATDGAINIDVTGGTPPYLYTWSNGVITQDCIGLSVGEYSITVTDANGCEVIGGPYSVLPDGMNVNVVVTDVSCNGANDGSIDVTVSGGNPEYTFLWSNGASTEDINNQAAGSYYLTVTDAVGVIIIVEAMVTESSAIEITSSVTQPSCNDGNDGAIDLSVSEPGSYTFLWSPMGETTEDINNLVSGTYSVIVTDINGCTNTKSFLLEETTELIQYVTPDTTICMGESIQLEASWIPNIAYNIEWTPAFGLSNPNLANPIATPTETTVYTVTASDGGGCTDVKEVLVTVNNYLDFGLQLFSNSPICAEEQLEFYSNFGGLSSYQWTGPNGFNSMDENPIVSNTDGSMSGEYSLTITDDGGCSVSVSFDVLIDDDCVWAGDTDTNLVVNNFDLLNIGLAYDSTGPIRNNASLEWIGQPATNWTQSTPTTLVNFKHADTDGNGVVNAEDTLAIIQNWGLMHNFTGTAPDKFTDLPVLTDGSLLNAPFYVEPDSLPEGETVELDIILGDVSNMVVGLYGIGFSIEYDPEIVVAGSARVDFNSSWLGEINNNTISIQKDFSTEGRIDVAITRIDGVEMNGAGLFGTFIITLEDDILFTDPHHEVENDVFADFSISNYHLINFSQEEILVEGIKTTAPVVSELSTNIHQAYLDKQIQLYPNPVNELFFISSKNIMIEQVNIYSTTKLINAIETNTSDVVEIPTIDLPNGIYFVELLTKKGVVTKKISVQR